MRYTPWGKADYSRSVVRGITFYSTSSHGGVFVTENAARKYLRKSALESEFVRGAYDRKANGYWFEEDCDATIVIFELCYTAPQSAVDLYKGKRTLDEIKQSCAASIDRWHGWYQYERGADGKAA